MQLENKSLRLSKFYLTIKIHKDPVVGRPICSSIGTVTHYTSKLLDHWLQPIAKKTSFYISNSLDFLLELENSTFPSSCVILTADIVSLYPSINVPDGLCQLKRALILHEVPVFYIDLLVDLCQWVLCNNYIEFGNTIWQQTKGTAMGTPISVCFAVIYLAMLELDIMSSCKKKPYFTEPIIIKRYIDDIGSVFIDTISARIFINEYIAIRPDSLALTYELSNTSEIFLVLEFFKGSRIREGKLDTKVYQKPKNQYLYIPPFSYHQATVFTATIKAELRRYRILCNNDNDFNVVKSLYYDRLLSRGYNSLTLTEIFDVPLERSALIEQRLGQKQQNDESIRMNINPLIITLPISLKSTALNLSRLLSNTAQDAAFDSDFYDIFGYSPRVITCYSRSVNLGDLLYQSRYEHEISLLPNSYRAYVKLQTWDLAIIININVHINC